MPAGTEEAEPTAIGLDPHFVSAMLGDHVECRDVEAELACRESQSFCSTGFQDKHLCSPVLVNLPIWVPTVKRLSRGIETARLASFSGM